MSDVGPWTKFADATPAPTEGPWTKYGGTGVVNTIVNAGRAAVKAVVGENEFDYPELVSAQGPRSVDDERIGNMMSDLLLARGEAGMKDVIKKHYPDAPFSKDKFGNEIVAIEGKPYYLNKSGLSGRDLEEFGRDVAVTAPLAGGAALLTGARSLLPRMLAQGAAGGGGSLAVDALSAQAGSEQGVDWPALVASVIGGATAEGLGSSGRWVLERIRTAPARYVTQTGELTDEGAKIFTEAGFDPADISGKIATEFARRVRQTGPTPATAREVAANEFGVPLTRGQATGDFDEIAFEQSAKAGARGELAGSITRDRFERQHAAIERSKGNVAEELAPGQAVSNPQDAAATVLSGVRRREDSHGQMVDAAYDQARDQMKGVSVDKDSLSILPDRVRKALREEGFRIFPESGTHPNAVQAMRMIEDLGKPEVGDLTAKSGSAVSPVGVALDAIEMVRREIGGRGGLLADAQKVPGDAARVKIIVKEFGRWLDDVTDDALMKGAPEAVQQLKNARAAASKHFALFGESAGKKGGDPAGRTIERMVDQDVTSNEVANYLWGSSKIGDSGAAYRVLKRIEDIVTRDSDEWNAIRAGMWRKMTSTAEGTDQPGAQAVSQSLFKFLNGPGRDMAELLYSAEERAMMRRYATVLKGTVPPKDATNPSKSGYEVARAVSSAFAGAPAYVKVFTLLGSARNTARAIPSGAPPARTPAPPGLPALGAVGADRYLADE